MSTLNVDKVDPSTGTDLELGTSGDTVTVPTGAGLTVTDEVKTNKISPATGTAFALGDSGDTFTLPSGATLVNSGTATGFGAIAWQSVVTATTLTAVAGRGYPINTTSNACTVTLPAGAVGDVIGIVDYAGTFDTNALEIVADGSEKINGSTVNVFMETERQGGTLTYVDATQGWLVTSAAPDPGVVLPTFIAATGPDGAAGTTDGDYKYHIFNASKTGSNGFSVSTLGNSAGSNTVEYLVVAGGGGGGQTGGGGGAGGYRTATGLSVSATDYNVTVGSGGAGNAVNGQTGGEGDDSIFHTITSNGGGGGGSYYADGADGGSGGGAAAREGTQQAGGSGNTPSTSPVQGYDGGINFYPGSGGDRGGGAGGGAGAIGGSGSSNDGGDGGAGVSSSITGSAVARGGGGGGCNSTGPDSSGGTGGGGDGSGGTGNGTVGTVNTGGGGGAGQDSGGSNAGSGVVIIRYKFQ